MFNIFSSMIKVAPDLLLDIYILFNSVDLGEVWIQSFNSILRNWILPPTPMNLQWNFHMDTILQS